MSKIEKYKEKLLASWDVLLNPTDEEEETEVGRERIVVFVVALILALCLWLMVNLSRDYNLNVELPISLGAVPQEQALAENLPEKATVSVSGEGWKLINLYNNPPSINVDVTNSEINVYDQVQQQMNMLPDISVQKVQPLILTVQLEERISKKVPLQSRVEVSFQDQYNFVGAPQLQPDSITVSGARSLVENITEWTTDSVKIENVYSDVSRIVDLKNAGNLLTISQQEARFEARVSQYTEGEVTVNVETRNLPPGRAISYSPSSITVTYDVPIEEYNEVQDINPFNAYITYNQITNDSSGFLTPKVEKTANDYHIKLRSFEPRRVAYFMQLD